MLRTVRFTVIDANETRHEITTTQGIALSNAIRRHGGIAYQADCGGSLFCGECHVIVDAADWERVGPPYDDEEDVLDMRFDLQRTSRLGCQIIMDEEFEGITVHLAS